MAVQRWRITFRRAAGTPEQTHQALAADWATRLAATGLPFIAAGAGGPEAPPRLTFAAPLPVRSAAERELLDVELAERRSIGDVRDAVAAALPAGIELVDLHDVWLGEPSLAGQARRAEYLVELAAGPTPHDLAAAAARLLGATTLIRQRDKAGRSVDYDLRPLVADVRVEDPGPPTTLGITTAFDPERGVGRPEDVLAALAGLMPPGAPAPEAAATTRRRVILAGEA